MDRKDDKTQGFGIFRYKDAPGLMEAGCIAPGPVNEGARAGLMRLIEAGMAEGDETKVLVNIPGFSLVHVWFKAGFPLPLHSHDADCLYYIVAGSIELGTESLGARDTFFIPKDAAYTYQVGPDGVELLEFRHETSFNFVNLVRGDTFWDKAVETVQARKDEWRGAKRPALNA